MKKFLKRANRGLLLGGIILVALIIYIIIDYSRFSSEKDSIKNQIEGYMDNFFDYLEANDYDSLLKLVNENWTGKPVMSDFYFTDMTDMSSEISKAANLISNEDIKSKYKVSDVSYRITSNSVKKAGPNMASVTLKYTITLNSPLSMDLILPFGIYYGYISDNTSSSDTTLYSCTLEGEYTLYMYKENGTWKFSQNSGYDGLNNMAAIQEVE